MLNHGIIEIFSATWWWSILISASMIWIIIKSAINLNERMQLQIANAVGFFLIFIACFIHIYQYYKGEWVLQSSLPLNLCSISGVLSGMVLIFPNQLAFEFLLFWGIPGAIHSFLTPEMTLGNQGWYFYDYYFMHSGIILSVLYLSLIQNYKPRKYSWLKVFLWSQALIVFVYQIDKLTGSNYMYLISKPIANNPLIMGDWPWYILILDIVALIHMYIVYLIFKKRNTIDVSLNSKTG